MLKRLIARHDVLAPLVVALLVAIALYGVLLDVGGFWHFFFAPPHESWFRGAVWGNVVAIVPCGVVAWAWSRTKVAALHAKLDEQHDAVMAHHERQTQLIEEVHHLAYTGQEHPAVRRRRAEGKHPTLRT